MRKHRALLIVADGKKVECRGCREYDEIVLTISHLNDDGYLEPAGSRSGANLHRRIINGSRSIDDLGIECWNCQARSRERFNASKELQSSEPAGPQTSNGLPPCPLVAIPLDVQSAATTLLRGSPED